MIPDWVSTWAFILFMLFATFMIIYAMVIIANAFDEIMTYVQNKRQDLAQRLENQREHDRRLLDLQFQQQHQIAIESGMVKQNNS